MRILVLIAIALLLYVIISNLFRKNKETSKKAIEEKMVRCHHCDLHILEYEAVQNNDNYYCSQEHMDLDK